MKVVGSEALRLISEMGTHPTLLHEGRDFRVVRNAATDSTEAVLLRPLLPQLDEARPTPRRRLVGGAPLADTFLGGAAGTFACRLPCLPRSRRRPCVLRFALISFSYFSFSFLFFGFWIFVAGIRREEKE